MPSLLWKTSNWLYFIVLMYSLNLSYLLCIAVCLPAEVFAVLDSSPHWECHVYIAVLLKLSRARVLFY